MLEHNELIERLKQVKMLITDVDGVMTDGGIYLGIREELKRFHTSDGAGIKYLIHNDIIVAFITGRESSVVDRRAHELGVREVHQRATRKLPVFEELLRKYEISPHQVAYVGDDLPDIPLLKRAGLAFAVANACNEIKGMAHYVTRASGGNGAVREIAELILRAQDKWTTVVNRYLEE